MKTYSFYHFKNSIVLLFIVIFYIDTVIVFFFISSSSNALANEKYTSVNSRNLTHISGLNISYPLSLHLNRQIDNTSLDFSLDDLSTSILTIQNLSTTSYDLESYIGDQIERYLRPLSNFSLLDINSTIIAKDPAFAIYYTYQNSSIAMEDMDIYAKIKDNIILFKYHINKDKYSKFLPLVQKIYLISSSSDMKEVPFPSFSLKKISGMYLDSDTNTLYMVDGSDTVFVADRSKNDTIKNIIVGSRPNDLTFMKNYYLYTANTGDNSISVIDPDTKNMIKRIPVGSSPVKIDSDPNLGDLLVFVTNYDSNSVSIVDGNTFKPLKNISVGLHPTGIAVNPLTNKLYVANSGSNTISIIEYHRLGNGDVKAKKTDLPYDIKEPRFVAVNPITNTIYISSQENLTSVDVVSNKTTSIHIDGPSPLIIDKKNNHIYIPNTNSPLLHIVDGKTLKIINNITLSTIPSSVSINQIQNIAYVGSENSDKFYMINTSSLHPLAQALIKIKNSPSIKVNCNQKNYTNNDYLLYEVNSKIECFALDNNNGEFTFKWENNSGSNPTTQENDSVNYISFVPGGYGILNVNPKQPTTLSEIQQTLKDNFRDIILVFAGAAIIGPVLGWYIPHRILRKENKTQRDYLRLKNGIIQGIYDNYKNSKGKCIDLLEQQKKELIELLQDGFINDVTFRFLNSRIKEFMRKLSQ